MKKNNILNKIVHNYEYRVYLLSIISVLITIIFLLYNFYIGLRYQLVWNFSITFYYLILFIVKIIILINENKIKKFNDETKNIKRVKLFKIENIFLLIIDFSLFIPIALMVLEKRDVNIGMIPAIAVAAYTTFKIVMSIINYHKTKKMNNLAIYGLKIINLKESIISIITLQNILIMTFNEGKSMVTFTSYTSSFMLISLIAISIYQIRLIKSS